MSDAPWKTIAVPNTVDAITAKRVDPELRWDFFWGRAIDQRCLFALQYDEDASPTDKLPKLKGIDITVSIRPGEARQILIFKLQDTAQQDIFEQLCRDIVRATAGAVTQKEAVATTLARTWRWHHLLRGGSSERLSADEQKGLIGELLVLERQLLECFEPDAAIPMWHGPLDAPKDFECARVCVEAKARRGAATPFVYISSAYQLDDEGVDAFFLFVVDLDQVPDGTVGAFTVADAAESLKDRLSGSPAALFAYENLLEASGFRWTDDYSDFPWLEGQSRFYRVADGFPRICASTLSASISNVTYALSLPSCAPYLVEASVVIQALKATQHV